MYSIFLTNDINKDFNDNDLMYSGFQSKREKLVCKEEEKKIR